MKKWGLALGGGGILGLAHVGVLQALEAQGLRPSIVTGTSAGAVVAALYACGVDLAGMPDVTAKALLEDDRWVDVQPEVQAQIQAQAQTQSLPLSAGIRPMALSGLISGDLIEAAIDRVVHGARLRDAEVGLAVTSVDIISGSIVVFTNVPPSSRSSAEALALAGRVYVTDAKLSEALRASVSMPGVFVPKKLGPWSLVDGGVRDMVPVYEARRMGAEEVVAVDLSLHVEKPQKTGNAVSILSRSFALASRESTERCLNEHASLTLQPDVWEYGLPTPTKLRNLMDEGRKCVEANLTRLIAVLR